jgi:hypothetical protein
MIIYEIGGVDKNSEKHVFHSPMTHMMEPKKIAKILMLILVGTVFVLLLMTIWTLYGVKIMLSIGYSSDEPWRCRKFNGHRGEIFGDLEYSGIKNKCVIAFDQHAHSIGSDDGWMRPNELVMWHRLMGYDAFAITDHNQIYKCEDIKKAAFSLFPHSMVVLCAVEWTTERFHTNIIFPPDTTIPQEFRCLSHANVSNSEAAIIFSIAHSLGATITYNHPSLTASYTTDDMGIQTAIDMGVDFIEVLTWRGLDAMAWKTSKNLGAHIIGGSDVHYDLLSRSSYTILGIEEGVEFSEITVFNELKARRTIATLNPAP